MVNGPHHTRFCENDLSKITDMIDKLNDQVTKLNVEIKEGLFPPQNNHMNSPDK